MKRNGLKATCFLALLVGLALVCGPVSGYAAEQKAPVDLNNASQKEIETIKGVGPATAKKIIESRPYASVDELSKAGLSPKMIEKIKPFVTVGKVAPAAPAAPAKTAVTPPAKAAPTTPAKTVPTPQKAVPAPDAAAKKPAAAAKLAPGEMVNINTSSKEQLEKLPGIGGVKAQAIIDGRPYQAKEDIMKVKGIKQGTFDKIKDVITVK